MGKSCANWQPAPGNLASYQGKTRAHTRNVIIIAEGRHGFMVVDAIGRKGINVRLTVKKSSLQQPQPDLFLQ